MAVTTNKSTSTTNRKPQGYATIIVTDKNGGDHQIESNDAWLYTTKASDNSINPVNSSLLKAGQEHIDSYHEFMTMGDAERAEIIAKGKEPSAYYEVPAKLRIKIPNQVTTEQTEMPF